MLLVDYLEDAAAYLKKKRGRLEEMNKLYRKTFDRDIKKEMVEVKKEIAKKTSEIYDELLLNLEEFQTLGKYYPGLVRAFMEDEYIGKILSKKAWLLNFRPLPPQEAAMRLQQLRAWRAQLRDAKRYVKKMPGTMDSRSLATKYPALRGYAQGRIDKHDALEMIEKLDRELLKEGWLVLLSDSLIHIPIAKFMTKVNIYRIQELQAESQLLKMRGKGTIAETAALRKFQEFSRKRKHYEKMVKQILLSNPGHLRALKRKKHWLSREKQGNLDKVVQEITPHSIKERVWLNEMRKKVEGKG